jgi:hypothetical protein
MNSQTLSSRADLEFAEATLRQVLVAQFHDAKTDAMSLHRMLVHLVNMHQAISMSPERHANVAKRLVDFATTVARMASRNPEAAPMLTKLSDILRSAGVRLRGTAPSGTGGGLELPPSATAPDQQSDDQRQQQNEQENPEPEPEIEVLRQRGGQRTRDVALGVCLDGAH